jgi:hypothetical protein
LLLNNIGTEIAKILGTTKNITASDSKIFAKDIGKYIDSKDQKRSSKKGKKKSKEKGPTDRVTEAGTRGKDKQDDIGSPALWPLIRQVNVRCPSVALAAGAILVDLPGKMESLAARPVVTYHCSFTQVWRMRTLLEITSPRIT